MKKPTPPFFIDNIVDYLSYLNVDEPANLTKLLHHFGLNDIYNSVIIQQSQTSGVAINFNTILFERNLYPGDQTKQSTQMALHLAIQNHDKIAIAQLSQILTLKTLTADYLFFDREVPKIVTNGELWDLLSLY